MIRLKVTDKMYCNLKAKSLKIFREKFAPEKAIRTAMVDYKKATDRCWLLFC